MSVNSFWDCPHHVYDEYWDIEEKEERREYMCSLPLCIKERCGNCPDGKSFNPHGPTRQPPT